MNEPREHDAGHCAECRRDFLTRAAYWTTGGALAFAAVGVARMPKPGVLPGKAATVKIGTPGDYPISSEPVRVPGQKLFVFHDSTGFWAVSAVCTHLGCIVTMAPEGFSCPCHGSRFGKDGRVIQGPAPSPLSWYEMGLGPDGQIIVDLRRTVPVGTKFALG